MIVRKMGIEWGGAFEEAQPVAVAHGGATFEFFITEKGELRIMIPASAKIEMTKGQFEVTIPTD